MRQLRWFRLLAVGALAAPIPAGAQTPQPKVREIATIPGVSVDDVVRLPGTQTLLYPSGSSIFAYDIMTKRQITVTTKSAVGWNGKSDRLAVSRRGDRIAFTEETEDYVTPYI
ncbi:MAG: hypothetical protein ACRELE_10935 [Gemmatimonadales bacterium]